MNILILDNYDSFTYNLYHLVKQVSKGTVDVFRNDKIKLEDIKKYDKVILSPGPGLPHDAGLMLDLIKQYATSKPILGVCLGMQAIGESFGGKLKNLDNVFHGVATKTIITQSSKLFENCPTEFSVGRYHSWVVDKQNFPAELEILSEDEQKNIMALRHKEYSVWGVQFHPESILTQHGAIIMDNFINKI